MSLFEGQVEKLRGLLKAAHPVALPRFEAELPAPKATSGLILESESAFELGSEKTRSALALVSSNVPGKDAAWLIGKPLTEITGHAVSFALIAIVSGVNLNTEAFYQFTLRFARLADHPGWMVKADKSRIWVRVGKDNVQNGLARAAASLISRIHATFETIESVELFFVVDDAPLVETLEAEAQTAQKLLREVKTGVWQGRGFDYESCELSGHCGQCSDKKMCASVRKIQAKVQLIRKNKTQSKEEQPCTR